MRIALYAPLKPPDHPVPSGDREMARLLIRALGAAGHQVAPVSDLRVFLRAPDQGLLARARAEARAEAARIEALWRREGPPDLWLCYHPYYKSPDLLGPALCARHGVAYATVESSWSRRRDAGDWGVAQQAVRAGLRQAVLNIALTARDARGLAEAEPGAAIARLAPFIDTAPFAAPPRPRPARLVTAAMMRPGDKLSSYLAMARALGRLGGPWRLDIAGDGPARAEVARAFAPFGARVRLLGRLDPGALAELFAGGWLYLWPGHGEAYGLATLEAQAAGLPVVAERTAGLPEIVHHGRTGLLTAPGDEEALAAAVAALAGDRLRRDCMARLARRHVWRAHGLEGAGRRLDRLLVVAVARGRAGGARGGGAGDGYLDNEEDRGRDPAAGGAEGSA